MTRPAAEAEGDRYLDLRTLAAYAGLSRRTLRTWLSHPAHPLPHYRVGGKILVRRAEFDAWVSQFRVAPPSRVETIVRDLLGAR